MGGRGALWAVLGGGGRPAGTQLGPPREHSGVGSGRRAGRQLTSRFQKSSRWRVESGEGRGGVRRTARR